MILRGGTLYTLDARDTVRVADLRITDGEIVEIDERIEPGDEDVLDCTGQVVLPGFVQGHVHLCQTLFRNLADDLELLDWLTHRIWPFEAWLTEETMAISAELGIAELFTGGTTSLLDMGSVHHTDTIFEVAARTGVRYTGGKCLMDLDETGQVPSELLQTADDALSETEELIERWHGSEGGRLRYAIAPRFAISCSDELLRRSGDMAHARGVRIHTHASEHLEEIAAVKARTGRENIDYLVDMGVLGGHTAVAHCVHLSEHEVNLLFGSGTHVVHCPSSNLKLASGIARIPELIEEGINVALGADGTPCNNRLSMFREMRLASLLHKPAGGPTTMSAPEILRIATEGGALALGIDDDVGSIEVGKKADLQVLDLRGGFAEPANNLAGAIVYSAGPENVRHVMVEGRMVKRDGQLCTIDLDALLQRARTAWSSLLEAFPETLED